MKRLTVSFMKESVVAKKGLSNAVCYFLVMLPKSSLETRLSNRKFHLGLWEINQGGCSLVEMIDRTVILTMISEYNFKLY